MGKEVVHPLTYGFFPLYVSASDSFLLRFCVLLLLGIQTRTSSKDVFNSEKDRPQAAVMLVSSKI